MSETPLEQGTMEAFILGLTNEQVHEALIDMGHDIECPTCEHMRYTLSVADGKPCLLDGKMVRHPGQALWFFTLICQQCGTSRLVEAVTVANHISEGVKHEG